MVFGRAASVSDPGAKHAHLETVIDGLFPGRWDALRPVREQELDATTILTLPNEEASARIRTGGPENPEADRSFPVWAGMFPARQVVEAPVTDAPLPAGVAAPANVTAFRLEQADRRNR